MSSIPNLTPTSVTTEEEKHPQGATGQIKLKKPDDIKVNPNEEDFDFSLAEGTPNAEAPDVDYREQRKQQIIASLPEEQPTHEEDLAKLAKLNEEKKRQVTKVDAIGALANVGSAFANYAYKSSPAIKMEEYKPTDTSKLDEDYNKKLAIMAQIKKRNEQTRKQNDRILENQMKQFDKISAKTVSNDKTPTVKPNYKSANINGQHYTIDSNTFTDETVLSLYDKYFGTPTDYKPTPTEKREMLLRYAQMPEYSYMRETLERNGVTFTDKYTQGEAEKVTMSDDDKKKYAKDKPTYMSATHSNVRHATVNDTYFDYDPNKVPDDTWYDIYGTWYGEKPERNMTAVRNRLFNDAVYDMGLRAKLKSFGVTIKDSNINRFKQ